MSHVYYREYEKLHLDGAQDFTTAEKTNLGDWKRNWREKMCKYSLQLLYRLLSWTKAILSIEINLL